MDAHAELERILAEQFDAPADAARNEKLAGLLQAHPELQDEYLDYLQLHALLQWRAGKLEPQSQPATWTGELTPARGFRWRSRRTYAAVLAVIAASLAGVFFLHTSQSQANPELVASLIDWNLDVAQAATPKERTRLYDEKAADLKATVAKTNLPREDRELAQTLLETSSWLTRNDDPLAVADRFNDIADKLVVRIDAATTAKNELQVVLLADTYSRVAEVGVEANLEKASASGALVGDQKQRWEHTTSRGTSRTKKLVEIIDRNPEASRRVIHRAMSGRHHKAKK
jgi:hypothetical protein